MARKLTTAFAAAAALIAASATPAAASDTTQCPDVAVTPRSGWVIADIRADGVPCQTARRQLKASRGRLDRVGWKVTIVDRNVDPCGSQRVRARRSDDEVVYTPSAC